ncbi:MULTISPECIES: hypothetical protein [Wolbachia]|uniref:hypothetical protein n=1 Tax=Wolbachia TaxID=953 RepID=UPI00068C9E20|nr:MULTISPECIES: hypothetical protein [Wolbachia]PBQ27650.1 hypothetical protein BTO27_03195 [Wolbachia pipientis wAus]UFO00399.1 hypothetical protein LOK48_00120 [Wolbachia endosymbiont of Corcyra cephalonica]
MLEKIKEFFKSIAKKIASGWKWLFGGKPSNAKQNLSSEQGKFSSKTLTKTLDNTVNHEKPVAADYSIHSNGDDSRAEITQSKERDKLPIIAGICENTPGTLELFVKIKHASKVFCGDIDLSGNTDLNWTDIIDRLKVYTQHVQSEKGEVFHITCDEPKGEKNGVFLNIKSVVSGDNKTSSDELAAMKKILGLNEKQATVAITQISKDPIIVPKSEISSSTTTPAASNGLCVSA